MYLVIAPSLGIALFLASLSSSVVEKWCLKCTARSSPWRSPICLRFHAFEEPRSPFGIWRGHDRVRLFLSYANPVQPMKVAGAIATTQAAQTIVITSAMAWVQIALQGLCGWSSGFAHVYRLLQSQMIQPRDHSHALGRYCTGSSCHLGRQPVCRDPRAPRREDRCLSSPHIPVRIQTVYTVVAGQRRFAEGRGLRSDLL